MRRRLSGVKGVTALAEKLSACADVTKFDEGEEREAWALAHALSDLEEAFVKIMDEQLPSLIERDLTPSEIYELLLDIGETLRHIIYHIRDPKFYGYLVE
jgi:hypothetical protein